MTWLTAYSNTLLKLDQEQEDAKALEALRAQLESKPLPDGTDDAITLLDKLRSGETVPGTESIPSELIDRLKKWFDKTIEANHNASQVRNLLLPIAHSCGNQQLIGALSWPLDTDASVDVMPDVCLKAGLTGKAKADFLVCPQLPEKAGAAPKDQAIVQIRVSGELKINAGIGLPVARFKTSAGISAEGAFTSFYYSLHSNTMRLASAVASGMGRLETAPFDLTAVSRRLIHKELHCIALNGKGSITLSGEIALASPISLGQQVNLAELAYNFTASLHGEFDYLIRADENFPDLVVLHLTRRRAASTSHTVGVKVGVDLSTSYQRIREELIPFLGKTQTVLAEAETWLAPGKMIEGYLTTSIGTLDASTELALTPCLNALLGSTPGSTATNALIEALSEEITNSLADIEEEAGTSASVLVERLLARLDVPHEHRPDLQEKLDGKVDEALSKVRKKATDGLRKIANTKTARELSEALEETGEKVQESLEGIDGKLAALRLLVTRYRELAAKLHTALHATTELKVVTSLEAKKVHENKQSADLVLRFNPNSPEAQHAYRLAVLGSFEKALELGRSSEKGIEILDCSLSQVVKESDELGLQVSVLGFALETSSVLNRKTRIDSDTQGNLTVQSEAAYEQRRRLLDESKTVRFADVFVLSAAKKTRSLVLETTLSYEDQKLEVAEAKGFFSSLVRAKLLSQSTCDTAVRLLSEVDRNTPTCNQEGRIDVGLALKGPALQKLLAIDGESSQLDRVMKIAPQEMALAYLSQQAGRTQEKDVISSLSANYYVAPTLEENIRVGLGPAIGGHTDNLSAWNHACAVNHMHTLCKELADALVAMHELTQVDPEILKTWDWRMWQEKQKAIMLKSKGNIPGDFPSLFGSEKVRPRTVALFRILASLSGHTLSAEVGDVLNITMSFCEGKTKRVVRVERSPINSQ